MVERSCERITVSVECKVITRWSYYSYALANKLVEIGSYRAVVVGDT